LAPACYKDEFFFTPDDNVCPICPFFYPCGTVVGHDWGNLNRKKIESEMLQSRVPSKDAIKTIVKLFGVSENAAALSYGRKKRKGKRG
jgi:hypothetical protein